MKRIFRSPLFWAIAIAGTLACFYEEPNPMPVEGTYVPYPYTNRARKADSMLQQRARNGSDSYKAKRPNNITRLYEIEVYENGHWRKIQQVKIKGLPQEETPTPDEVWDEMEGK